MTGPGKRRRGCGSYARPRASAIRRRPGTWQGIEGGLFAFPGRHLRIEEEPGHEQQHYKGVDGQLDDARLPVLLSHPELHLRQKYAPDARYDAYVDEGIERKGVPVYLAHDLAEELHDDEHEHKVAYDVGDGVRGVVDEVRYRLEHQEEGDADDAQCHPDEYHVIDDGKDLVDVGYYQALSLLRHPSPSGKTL